MNPQDTQLLTKLTLAVKKIVYDPQRFKTFLGMLGSKEGAITAVHTILALIQHEVQVPPALLPQLGVNAYLIMVEVAEHVTGHKADPHIVHDVVQMVMQGAASQPDQGASPNPAQTPNQPIGSGIIGNQMGAQ